MVQEKAGFLTAQYVRFKLKAGFQKDNRLLERGSVQNFAVVFAPFAENSFLNIPAQAQHDAVRLQSLPYQPGDFSQARQPGCRVKFQNESVRVAIENQTRPAIAFAIDPSEAGRLVIK